MGPRPDIVVRVLVEGRYGAFRLTAEDTSDPAADMRASLASAAERLGLKVVLPRKGGVPDLQGDGVPDGRVVLEGHFAWSDEALSWIVLWYLHDRPQDQVWTQAGVSFDEAFRTGLRGTAQVLSGNGTPR